MIRIRQPARRFALAGGPDTKSGIGMHEVNVYQSAGIAVHILRRPCFAAVGSFVEPRRTAHAPDSNDNGIVDNVHSAKSAFDYVKCSLTSSNEV